MSKPVRVKCPTCRREGDWLAAEWGPFCSQRCRLIDLGKWLGEEHVISRSLDARSLEHVEDLPLGDREDGTNTEDDR